MFFNKKCKVYIFITVSIIGFFQISHAVSTKINNEKCAVFVLGPGRSGTSCISGVLNILGVDFGENLRPAEQFNEKGTFEELSFLKFNRLLFRDDLKINYWLTPQIIKWDQVQNRELLKDKVKELMEETFETSPLFGIKNSYIAFLLPIYIQAAEELGCTVKLIVTVREPMETALSWKKIYPHKTGKINNLLEMISKCYISIAEHCIGHDTVVVHFDDVLNNTEAVIDKLYAFIPGVRSFDDAKDDLEQFLDKNLKHENS